MNMVIAGLGVGLSGEPCEEEGLKMTGIWRFVLKCINAMVSDPQFFQHSSLSNQGII
jgi:hypothetical protein